MKFEFKRKMWIVAEMIASMHPPCSQFYILSFYAVRGSRGALALSPNYLRIRHHRIADLAESGLLLRETTCQTGDRVTGGV